MCGRFAQTAKFAKIMKDFDIAEINRIVEEVQAKYNCAPGQEASVITADNGFKTLDRFGWGITRVKRDGGSLQLINIRYETYTARPSPRAQRCIIPVDGFYEWQASGRVKQPFYFHRSDDSLLALAGLYEPTDSDSNERRFAVVTVPAIGEVARIHERMPFILSQEACTEWLAGNDIADYFELYASDPAIALVSHPVSPEMNSPAFDAPKCVEPFNKHELFDD